ncbi:hypothetical protein F2Q70_00035598 [Brassica cretica]|uniref:Uncharacterized protein n=1 Tax=Brassica cretica TaxID=69181 RepID=A0A8S9JT05_BRACR|nr:hypothetical protein F2Q70_00035598 [Brassica cretica]
MASISLFPSLAPSQRRLFIVMHLCCVVLRRFLRRVLRFSPPLAPSPSISLSSHMPLTYSAVCFILETRKRIDQLFCLTFLSQNFDGEGVQRTQSKPYKGNPHADYNISSFRKSRKNTMNPRRSASFRRHVSAQKSSTYLAGILRGGSRREQNTINQPFASHNLKVGCSNTADVRLLRFWENVKKGGECGHAPSCSYGLSIVLVSVVDRSLADVRKFNDMIPKPDFKIMKRNSSELSKETAFILPALNYRFCDAPVAISFTEQT